MLRFLAFRILQFPLILAIIYVSTFLLAWVAPGSPFEKERKLAPETKKMLEEKFHADSPAKFLTHYPWKILTSGDFGPSLNYQEFSVNDIMRKSLPVSVTLGLAAVGIALIGGVFLGTIAAVRRNGVMDWTSLGIALIGVSVPSFVGASMLLSSFAFSKTLGLTILACALSLAAFCWLVMQIQRGMQEGFGHSIGQVVVASVCLLLTGYVAVALFSSTSSLRQRVEASEVFPLGGWPGGMEYGLSPADTPERQAMLAKATPDLKAALHDAGLYFEPVIKRNRSSRIDSYEVTNKADVEVPAGEDWDELMNHGPKYYELRVRWGASLLSYLRHMTLPALALALLPMAYITRLTRVSMIDVLASDYVRTARAKGLSRPKVIWRHCLRNAFLPVLSYIGPATAATLVGSFVVEKVFNIPGMGDYFVRSVLNRDQTLILGTVMVYSVLLLSLNLFVDVMYSVVDPRIKME